MRYRPPSANILVSNLPEDLTANDLAELFDEFGLVLNARIGGRSDPKLPPRGFIDLAPTASVERAVSSLNGRVVRSRKLKVSKLPSRIAVKRQQANEPLGSPPPRGRLASPERPGAKPDEPAR